MAIPSGVRVEPSGWTPTRVTLRPNRRSPCGAARFLIDVSEVGGGFLAMSVRRIPADRSRVPPPRRLLFTGAVRTIQGASATWRSRGARTTTHCYCEAHRAEAIPKRSTPRAGRAQCSARCGKFSPDRTSANTAATSGTSIRSDTLVVPRGRENRVFAVITWACAALDRLFPETGATSRRCSKVSQRLGLMHLLPRCGRAAVARPVSAFTGDGAHGSASSVERCASRRNALLERN